MAMNRFRESYLEKIGGGVVLPFSSADNMLQGYFKDRK